MNIFHPSLFFFFLKVTILVITIFLLISFFLIKILLIDEKASLVRQFEEAKVKLQQLTYDQQQLELIKTENEILEHSIEQEKSRLSLMEQRVRIITEEWQLILLF